MNSFLSKKTGYYIIFAAFCTAGIIFDFIKFPAPIIFPDFLKMDISVIPSVIIAFTFGVLPGILLEFIKNTVHLFIFYEDSKSINEIANFIINCSFIYCAGALYTKNITKKNAVIGCLLGSLAITAAAAFIHNSFVIPAYDEILYHTPEDIIEAVQKTIPFVKTQTEYILYCITPFYLLKGLLATGITVLIYKKIEPLLNWHEYYPDENQNE